MRVKVAKGCELPVSDFGFRFEVFSFGFRFEVFSLRVEGLGISEVGGLVDSLDLRLEAWWVT